MLRKVKTNTNSFAPIVKTFVPVKKEIPIPQPAAADDPDDPQLKCGIYPEDIIYMPSRRKKDDLPGYRLLRKMYRERQRELINRSIDELKEM